MNKTLIFIATYNEVENISKLLDDILSQKLEADIYIIDDNSPDKTSDIVKSYCNKNPNILLKIR